MMAEFHLAASRSRYCACWLTITLSALTGLIDQNRAIVNVISNSSAVPTVTSQNVGSSWCSLKSHLKVWLCNSYFRYISKRIIILGIECERNEMMNSVFL